MARVQVNIKMLLYVRSRPLPVIRIKIADATHRVEGQGNEGESTGPVVTHFAGSSMANRVA